MYDFRARTFGQLVLRLAVTMVLLTHWESFVNGSDDLSQTFALSSGKIIDRDGNDVSNQIIGGLDVAYIYYAAKGDTVNVIVASDSNYKLLAHFIRESGEAVCSIELTDLRVDATNSASFCLFGDDLYVAGSAKIKMYSCGQPAGAEIVSEIDSSKNFARMSENFVYVVNDQLVRKCMDSGLVHSLDFPMREWKIVGNSGDAIYIVSENRNNWLAAPVALQLDIQDKGFFAKIIESPLHSPARAGGFHLRAVLSAEFCADKGLPVNCRDAYAFVTIDTDRSKTRLLNCEGKVLREMAGICVGVNCFNVK